MRPVKQLLQVRSTRTVTAAETFSDAAGKSPHREEQEDMGEAFSSRGKKNPQFFKMELRLST